MPLVVPLYIIYFLRGHRVAVNTSLGGHRVADVGALSKECPSPSLLQYLHVRVFYFFFFCLLSDCSIIFGSKLAVSVLISEHVSSKNFLGEHAPTGPPRCCMLTRTELKVKPRKIRTSPIATDLITMHEAIYIACMHNAMKQY